MRTVFRARWVLPITQPPVPGGWVAVDAGRILAVGGPGDTPPAHDDEAVLDAAILPGLVNAHTHLELSWMRNQVPPAPSMPEWVGRMLALRRTVGPEPVEPIVAAIHELRATGTTLIGDVCNTFGGYAPLAESDLSAAVFH